jgi:hypothetical protein
MAGSNGPRIVTNGLVLHLDAADRKSYPGSGTSWFDLSGNNNTCTLINGPTFSSLNNGSIVFDGTNDYVTRSSVVTNLSAGVSMEMMFKSTDMNSRGQGFMTYNVNLVNYINFYTPGNGKLRWEAFPTANVSGGYVFSSNTLSNNTWYHALGTYNSNGTSVLYINGSNVASASFTAGSYSSTYTTLFELGSWVGLLSGSIAIARIYNRALTASEVLQNFNATRGRFGI